MKFKLYLIHLLFFILISFSEGSAQEESKVYSRFSHTIGFAGYIDNLISNQALDNRFATFINSKGYFVRNKQWFIKASAAKSHAYLNRPIEIRSNVFHEGDQFNLSAYSVNAGYEIKMLKVIDVCPYSGILFNEYALQENGIGDKYYVSRLGIPLGLDFMWRTKMSEEKGRYFHLYLNNSINYSGLNKVSESFSDFYYAYEVGFGITKKYQVNAAKKKRKRRKK